MRESSFWSYAIGAATIAAAIGLSQFAFTEKQKDWIRRRDGNRCQAPFPHHCADNGKKPPVHHILPDHFLQHFHTNPDVPENGITVCQNAHDMIHPDVPGTRRAYHQDKDAFKKLRDQRDAKLKQKQPYWRDTWDRAMQVIALRQTQDYETPDNPFPDAHRKPRKQPSSNTHLNPFG
jgi:hypothetical protein